jgi:hypothetical protein
MFKTISDWREYVMGTIVTLWPEYILRVYSIVLTVLIRGFVDYLLCTEVRQHVYA